MYMDRKIKDNFFFFLDENIKFSKEKLCWLYNYNIYVMLSHDGSVIPNMINLIEKFWKAFRV